MGTELTYRIKQQNVETSQQVKLNLIINYDKPIKEYVFIKEIKINLPVGNNSYDLIKNASCTASIIAGSDNDANNSNQKLWQVSSDKNEVKLTPFSGVPQLITVQGIEIEISGLNINDNVGTSQVTITETAQVNDNDKYDPSKNLATSTSLLPIMKCYQGFYLGDLKVVPSDINPGESVRVYWNINIPHDCSLSLTLSWTDTQKHEVNVINQSAYPFDPQKNPLILYNYTQFTLNALVGSDRKQIQCQESVTVKKSFIQSFSPSRDLSLIGDAITFTWQTIGIDYCQIKKNDLTIPNCDKLNPNDSITIKFDMPLGKYKLFAYYHDNDNKKNPVIIQDSTDIKALKLSSSQIISISQDSMVTASWVSDYISVTYYSHNLISNMVYKDFCSINIENEQVKEEQNNYYYVHDESKNFKPEKAKVIEINSISTNTLTKYKIINANNLQVVSNITNTVIQTYEYKSPINYMFINNKASTAYVVFNNGIFLIKPIPILNSPVSLLLSNSNTVSELMYISLRLDTWVVNKNVASAQPKHPERTIRRWQPVFSNLNDFESPVTQPFSGEDQNFCQDKNMGVYLHWTLPQGLRHATKRKSDGILEYPLTPNRWLVVRLYGPAEKRLSTAWIIESDFIDHQKGTTPFPDQTQVGQNLIGRKIELNNWQESAADKKMFLTAVGNGDITFSAYQPYNENVFSFHDPLITESNIKKDTLSYFVVGWYSNIKENPFYSCKTKDEFTSLLDKYLLDDKNINNLSILPGNIICHAMVSNISWDIDGEIPAVSSSPQDKIDPSKIELALGNTSLDALAALVNQHDPSIPDYLFKAFSQGLLDKLEAIDGEGEVAHKYHQLGFGMENGGSLWAIVNDESADKSNDDLTQEQIKCVNNLNNIQILNDQKVRLYRAKQWNLYALWYKHGQAKANGYSQEVELNKQLTIDLDNLIKANQELIKLKQNLQNTYQEANKSLQKNQKLKQLQNNVFWHPNDPVVLITGIQSGWRDSFTTNKDTWRTENQMLTSLHVGSKQINAADIDKITPPISFEKIPVNITKLYQEFLLLDITNANAIAIATGVKIDDFIAARNALLNNQKLSLPKYGLQPWVQAWFPLFLEWEIEWYPIPINNWKFQNNDYVIQTIPKNINSQILYGRTLLTPQSSFSIKSRLQQLLKDNPNIEKELNNIDFQKLLQTVQEWDVLSQCISGFHQQLILRDTKIARIPANQSDESNLYQYISEQCHTPPIAGAMSSDPFGTNNSFFQPLRNGQFCLHRLSVVDRFGQTVNVVQNNTYKNLVPIVSNDLKPDSNFVVSPGSPLRFIQLPPRIIQSIRLNADWVSAKDDNKPIKINISENPIYGWVVPNYLDHGLQVFDALGKYLGDLGIRVNNSGPKINWIPAPNSKYAQLDDLINDSRSEYSTLGSILNNLKSTSIDDYKTLFSIFDDMFFNTPNHSLQKNSTYFSAFAGRPLALARTQWQLESAQPLYNDLSWVPDSEKEKVFLNTQYQLKLGIPTFNQNGLAGYFVGNEWNKFYSVYPQQLKDSHYIKNVDDNLLELSNANNQSLFITILFDPYAKVYASTGILPVVDLMLQQSYFKKALQEMEITYRVGPLLTLRKQNASNVSETQPQPILHLPKSSTKKVWKWIEQTKDKKWQELMTQSTDDRAKLESDNYEIDTGLLSLKMWDQSMLPLLVPANLVPPNTINTEISNTSTISEHKFPSKKDQNAACQTLRFTRVLSQLSTLPKPFDNLNNQHIICRILFFANKDKNLNVEQIRDIVSYGRDKKTLGQKQTKEQFLQRVKLA